jgi:hypothetical protein
VTAGNPASSGRERAIGGISIRDQRLYAVILATFLLATTATSLYDTYLLLSLLAG